MRYPARKDAPHIVVVDEQEQQTQQADIVSSFVLQNLLLFYKSLGALVIDAK